MTIIGVHTPETTREREVETVKQKAVESGFRFPIVVDNDKNIWSSWGNSWWPSVYLIDKKGYIRYWWYGELKWQGNDGEQVMRRHIEELLAERE